MPEIFFSYLVPLLGTEFNTSKFQNLVKAFKLNDNAWKITNPERLALGATLSDNFTSYDIEEILAMILRDAKKLSERAAGESLSDVVIAIPPQYDTHQRIALVDACKLAGLNPIAFLNENIAASIRYAIDVGVGEKRHNKSDVY